MQSPRPRLPGRQQEGHRRRRGNILRPPHGGRWRAVAGADDTNQLSVHRGPHSMDCEQEDDTKTIITRVYDKENKSTRLINRTPRTVLHIHAHLINQKRFFPQISFITDQQSMTCLQFSHSTVCRYTIITCAFYKALYMPHFTIFPASILYTYLLPPQSSSINNFSHSP